MEASKANETLASLTGLEGPVFIRKLTRKSHWGDEGTTLDARLSVALHNIFDESVKVFSFYRAETVPQLAQIAIGLNSKRSSLKENIDFVPFSEHELKMLDLELINTPGETNCYAANSLHFDIRAEIQSLAELCRIAMQNKRTAARLSKSWIEQKLREPRFSRCFAITRVPNNCDCI